MWHTRTYFHSLINVCDRFLERTKLSRSGARPGRELFITRLGLGAHGGANGLVPLLPASLCEHEKSIRIALGERHAEIEQCEKLCREVPGLCPLLVSSVESFDSKERSMRVGWLTELPNDFSVEVQPISQ